MPKKPNKVYLFDEIILIVFDFLRLKEIFKCMQTSHRWYELANLRLKSDTSKLKKWHQTDQLLSQHPTSHINICGGLMCELEYYTSIFLEDLGLLVVCENAISGIPISFFSARHHCVKLMLHPSIGYENYLRYFYGIFHYYPSERKLIFHLKRRNLMNHIFHYIIDLTDLKSLQVQRIFFDQTLNSVTPPGRCEYCFQFLSESNKILLHPSPRYYKDHKNIIFVNNHDTIKVGCVVLGKNFNVYVDGNPFKQIELGNKWVSQVDSEHIFNDGSIINVFSGKTYQIQLHNPIFYQVGSQVLFNSLSTWRLIEQIEDTWKISEPLLRNGYFPTFCPRENRLLFF